MLSDPKRGRLSNHWVTLHEIGNVARFNPVLVLDVWEHAFLLTINPPNAQNTLKPFFANIDWNVVEERLKVGAHV